jgi:hypothetical protein
VSSVGSVFARALPALLPLLLLPFLIGPSCGSDFGDKGLGEPCTRDNECQEGLACVGGTCRDEGGTVDGSLDDGGDGAAPTDSAIDSDAADSPD